MWRRTLGKLEGARFRVRSWLRGLREDRVSDPFRLVSVDPNALRTIPRGIKQLTGVDYYYSLGVIFSGEYDRTLNKPIRMRRIIPAAEDHFLQGQPWEATDYYQVHLGRLRDQHPNRAYASKEELDERVAGIDRLYESIRANGYKSQAELGSDAAWHEIYVVIDRCGEVMFYDGGHRLAIARVLGLRQVPALVLARHRDWYEFSESIRDRVASGGGVIRHQLCHPDLADVVSELRPSQTERLVEVLACARCSVIDLDPEYGTVCSALEDAGRESTASAADAEHAAILGRLRAATRHAFEVASEAPLALLASGRFSAAHLTLRFCRHWRRSTGDDALAGALRAADLRCLTLDLGGTDRSTSTEHSGTEETELVGFLASATGMAREETTGGDAQAQAYAVLKRD